MNPLLRSAMWLSGATMISKLIGTLQKIPLQNYAGDSVFGYYNAAYPMYTMIMFVATAGLPMAVSACFAQAYADGANPLTAHQSWLKLRSRMIIVGIMLGLFMLLTAPILANMMGIPELDWPISALALAMFWVPLLSTWRGWVQARGQMQVSAISQVIEQFVRVTAMVLFLIIGIKFQWPDQISAAAVHLGTAIGAACALGWAMWRTRVKDVVQEFTITEKPVHIRSRTILRMAWFASIGSIAFPLFQWIDSLSLPGIMGIEEYGVFTRPFIILQLAAMLMLSLLAAGTPDWVRRYKNGDPAAAREPMGILAWIAIPAAAGMSVLGGAMNMMFFTDTNGHAVWSILAVVIIPMSIQLAGAQILLWEGRGSVVVRWVLLGSLIKWLLNLVWVHKSEHPLEAGAWALLITYSFVALGHFVAWLRIVRKRALISEKRESMKEFIYSMVRATIVMVLGVILISSSFANMLPMNRLGATLTTLIGLLCGVAIYWWLWKDQMTTWIKRLGTEME